MNTSTGISSYLVSSGKLNCNNNKKQAAYRTSSCVFEFVFLSKVNVNIHRKLLNTLLLEDYATLAASYTVYASRQGQAVICRCNEAYRLIMFHTGDTTLGDVWERRCRRRITARCSVSNSYRTDRTDRRREMNGGSISLLLLLLVFYNTATEQSKWKR